MEDLPRTVIVMTVRMTNRIAWKWIGLKQTEVVEGQLLSTQFQGPVKEHATTGVADPLTILVEALST